MSFKTSKLTYEKIEKILNVIEKYYKVILEDGYQYCLGEAKAKAKASWKAYGENSSNQWGFSIPDNQSLMFKRAEVLTDCHVDVYCKMQWEADSSLPVEQDIKIRVWSKHRGTIFREELDAHSLQEHLGISGSKRVISRFHFDRANHSQGKKSIEYHPEYHFQVGGKSLDYEYCWHPKSFDIPRFMYQPMDLFLTCQLVAANFFPNAYKEIKENAAWRGVLYDCQKMFWLEYYTNCSRVIEGNSSLLDEVSS